MYSLQLAKKADSTIKKYRQVFEQFFNQCTISIRELSSDDVHQWLQKYSEGKKTGTINVILSILSSFFQFCLIGNYLEKVIIKKHWRPKMHQPIPKHLTEQEYVRVKFVAEKSSLRDRLIILFLTSSGCRRSEAAQLNIEDIQLNKRTATVIGKGRKIRNIHFSEECALVLTDYLKTRSGNKEEPLFINRFGQRLSGNGIYMVTTKIGKLAGLTQPLHPHILRHTFATNMLARGAEIEFIADELGHSNLDTTRVYARILTEDLRLLYHNIMG